MILRADFFYWELLPTTRDARIHRVGVLFPAPLLLVMRIHRGSQKASVDELEF